MSSSTYSDPHKKRLNITTAHKGTSQAIIVGITRVISLFISTYAEKNINVR